MKVYYKKRTFFSQKQIAKNEKDFYILVYIKRKILLIVFDC